jgi:hypothetical protein
MRFTVGCWGWSWLKHDARVSQRQAHVGDLCTKALPNWNVANCDWVVHQSIRIWLADLTYEVQIWNTTLYTIIRVKWRMNQWLGNAAAN